MDTTAIITAFTSVPVPVPVIVKYGLIGAVLGAVFVPLFFFVAIKFNHDRLGEAYAPFRRTPGFYGVLSRAGAGLFALIGASQPVLDAAGDNEIYIRGALIPVIMIFVFIPAVRALKEHRSRR